MTEESARAAEQALIYAELGALLNRGLERRRAGLGPRVEDGSEPVGLGEREVLAPHTAGPGPVGGFDDDGV